MGSTLNICIKSLPKTFSISKNHNNSSNDKLFRPNSLQPRHSLTNHHRYSGTLQEPDSPATCLAFKITRTRLKYKWTDLETNSGIIYSPLASKISHCADIKVIIVLPNGTQIPNPLVRNIDSSICDLIKLIRFRFYIVLIIQLLNF